MDIKTVQEDLDAIKAEYDAKIEEIREVGLTKLFKSFFEANPDIQAISFTGYIPGFNDGDPCVFGLGEVNFAGPDAELGDEIPDYDAYDYDGWFHAPSDYLYVKDEKGNAIQNPDWDGKTYGFKPTGRYLLEPNPEARPELSTISKFISRNDDLMNKLFGDNFKAVITPQEIRVEEYDCGY